MIIDGLRTVLIADAGINALVAGRVWPQTAPQRATLPLILLYRQHEDHNLTLTDTGGLVFADFEIDCLATTPASATSLAELVSAVLDDYVGAMGDCSCEAVLIEDVFDSYEPPQDKSDVGRHVTTLLLQIQYRP